MKWIITENTECECPGFTVDILPQQIPAKLRVLFRDQQVFLEADGLAGIIPCKGGNSIVINPKCKNLEPFSMYEYINNLSISHKEDQDVDLTGTGIDINTVAIHFARELISIQCHQRLIKRLPSKQKEPVIKGHVDWISTSRLWASGQKKEIVTTIRESTYDIPENEVISMAANVCLPLFENTSNEWKILHSWSTMKYRCPLTKEQLSRIHASLRNSRFSGAHAYYFKPVCLALIILGVDDAGNMNAQDQSILFNMPGLYEDYIRTAFMRKSVLKGYSCQKGFIPRSFLFSDGTCELEPDITIYDGSRIKAVLDVKYKVPDSKDYYQIFTYMKFAGLNEAYIISPFVRHLASITAYDGSKIININVASSNHTILENIVGTIVGKI